MAKNRLQFSEDGTEFKIIFKSEGESITFTSKETGFKAITDMAEKKKITVGEFSEMRNQILAEERLPWAEDRNSEEYGFNFFGSSLLDMLFGRGGLGGFGFGASISFDNLEQLFFAPKEPVEIAYFKMCDCGGNHGRIYTKGWFTRALRNRSEAEAALEELKGVKAINEAELEKVKAEIAQSPLPAEKKEATTAQA